MATNQTARIDIYEGIMYIHLKASEAMAAGDVVALDGTSGTPYFCKCGTSGVPFGWVAEQVTAAGVQDYEPGGLVSHTAKVGDYVGVYICGGVYNHAQASLTYGQVLYAGTSTAGKASGSASSNATKIGIVVEASDTTTGYAKVKSLI